MQKWEQQRKELVENYLAPEIADQKILQAFRKVPRHLFIPEDYRHQAYQNRALPIGEGQTISQPSLIALSLQKLSLEDDHEVLDVGTGSGYQAALLSKIVKQVTSVEILDTLAEDARQRLNKLNYDNTQVIVGDGTKGFLPQAPYDAIVVSAAGKKVPQPLEDQLKTDKKIVIPIRQNDLSQILYLGTKQDDKEVEYEELARVAFVPLIENNR